MTLLLLPVDRTAVAHAPLSARHQRRATPTRVQHPRLDAQVLAGSRSDVAGLEQSHPCERATANRAVSARAASPHEGAVCARRRAPASFQERLDPQLTAVARLTVLRALRLTEATHA
jgi:hypothetical protein